MKRSHEQRLAVHAAEQPARKPNARRHGSKPTVQRKDKQNRSSLVAAFNIIETIIFSPTKQFHYERFSQFPTVL